MQPSALKRRALIAEIRRMPHPKNRHHMLSNGMMVGDFSAHHIWMLVHRRTKYADIGVAKHDARR